VCGHLDRMDDLEVAVVTFAEVADLAPYRSHLSLPLPVLADPDRALYRRFGFPRASFRAVYGVGTMRMYARLVRQGRRLRRPQQDTRQLGGDVVVGPDGRIVEVFRPRSPDDRPSMADLFAAVDRARGAGGP
jgi:hypothetical protein